MRTHGLYAGALAAVIWAALPAQAQPPQAIPLPPGDGRDIVAKTCTTCHSLNTVLQLRQSAAGWRSIVDYMVLHGAPLTPDGADQAVTYLATNFGPGINLPPQTTKVSLPDGPGKHLVATNCVVCHSLDRIAATRRTPSDWTSVVSRMQFLGAPISAGDKKSITAYLDMHFGAKQP
jgi:mono/diheme cytochrome c family protein